MVKFLTTTEVTAEIEKLIKEADKKVTLISPYVDIPRTLLQNLQSACERNVEIRLIYGKRQGTEDNEELKREIKVQLAQLNTLTLRYLDNLHAKCYFNERHMVISSMNLYDYSAHQNREMGILISEKDDKEVFDDAVREANDIIRRAKPKSLKSKEAKSTFYSATKDDSRTSSRAVTPGFCIRCGKQIPYNSDYPLCNKCFKIWERLGDPNYKEKYCHFCGKRRPTSKARPLCDSCWDKSQR